MRTSIQEHLKEIAEAARLAKHDIATAAADALKVKNEQFDGDHDIIVELRVRMEDLKNAIQALTDGTAKQISDHEKRLVSLEKSKDYTTTMLTVGTGLLIILSGLLFYHIFGMKP